MNQTDYYSFGDVLRGFRQRARMSQIRLAALLRKHRNTIRMWERGDYLPHTQADVYEISYALALSSQDQDTLLRTYSGMMAALTQAKEKTLLPPSTGEWTNPALSQLSRQTSLFSEQDLLVAHLKPLIGRQQDVQHLKDLLLKLTVRLVILKGIGGVGKTRLALEMLRELQDNFADGIHFLSLAAIRDAQLVLPTIVKKLDILEGQKYPLAALQRFLSHRETLLILDNCEQIAEAIPQLAHLLITCPGVKLLLTSRTRLPLRAGYTYTLHPLPLPLSATGADMEEIRQNPSVALYVERAQEELAEFCLSEENTPAIAQLCTQLYGIPLALELAAARVELFSPQALLKESRWLDILAQEGRGRVPRQQRLRDTIAWSYHLLNPDEQRLFRRLVPFRSGFTKEAIVAINIRLEEPVSEVLQSLSTLMDSHLLLPQQRTDEERRFTVIDVIHEYAQEQLLYSGEEHAVYQAHAHYFLSLAQRAESDLEGPRQLQWVQRLNRETENIRASLLWFQQTEQVEQQLRLCAALGLYWIINQEYAEGCHWLEQAIANLRRWPFVIENDLKAKVLYRIGYLAPYYYDDLNVGLHYLEESLALYRQLGNLHGIACTSSILGWHQLMAGSYTAIRPYYEESLPIFEQEQNWWHLAEIYGLIGGEARALGDIARARLHYEQSLLYARKSGDIRGKLAALGFVGQVMYEQQDFAGALGIYSEHLASAIQLGGKPEIAASLQELGDILVELHRYSLAARLWGAAFMVRSVLTGFPFFNEHMIYEDLRKKEQSDYQEHDQRLKQRVLEQLGKDAFEVAWNEGRTLLPEQALEMLISAEEDHSKPEH